MINLKNILNDVAVDYWKSRGAKIGEVQTIKDIQIEAKDYHTINNKYWSWGEVEGENGYIFKDDQFITHMCVVETTDNPYAIRCTLWVKPILKSKKVGLPIRLTYEWIVTDNPTYVNNDPNNGKITTSGGEGPNEYQRHLNAGGHP